MSFQGVDPIASSTTGFQQYVSLTVQEVLESLNLNTANTNDITLLSAIPYLPSTNPFDQSSINAAAATVSNTTNAARTSGAAPNSPSGVNVTVADNVVAQIASLIGTSTGSTVDSIVNAFQAAGRDGFLTLLADRIGQNSGTTPDSLAAFKNRTIDPNGNVTPLSLFNTVVQAIQAEFVDPNGSAHLLFVNDDGSDISDIAQVNGLVSEIVNSAITSTITLEDARNYVFDTETISGLIQFGLGPWLVLEFIYSSYISPNSNYFTKVYANYALVQAAVVAVTRLQNAFSSTDPNFTTLGTKLTVLNNSIQLASIQDYSSDILTLMRQSSHTKDASSNVVAANSELNLRLARAKDLQVSFQVEDRRIFWRRIEFYAWIIALISVVGTSAYLLGRSKLAAFLVLAASTSALLVLYLLGLLVARLLR